MRTLNKTLRIGIEQGEDAECCMHKSARDSIPVGTSWQPGQMAVQMAQSKRQATNDQESKDRRAVTPALVVGDTIVICDRYPGFRTLYEKELWKVTHIQGTMITAMHGQNQVTRNATWFKRATPGMTTSNEESGVDDSGVPETSYPASSSEDEEQARLKNTNKYLTFPQRDMAW